MTGFAQRYKFIELPELFTQILIDEALILRVRSPTPPCMDPRGLPVMTKGVPNETIQITDRRNNVQNTKKNRRTIEEPSKNHRKIIEVPWNFSDEKPMENQMGIE